ncbi:MAG: ribonuclease R [Lachnospiraceae bacterium]
MDRTFLEENKKHILELFDNPQYKPMKLKELAILLQVPIEERANLQFILDELLAEGKISVSAKGKYGKLNVFCLTGVLSVNPRGFGFVKVEGREQDIFISPDCLNGAMHQDTVLVTVISKNSHYGKRDEGVITKVLEHNVKQVVGYFKRTRSNGWVIPDNPRLGEQIFVTLKNAKGAVTGHRVVVEIDRYADAEHGAEGHIIEILGHSNDPQTDILAIVYDKQIPMEFPEEVLDQAANMPDEVAAFELKDRMDLRQWETVTIDGEDAKDLDDAITLTKEDGFYQLGVHIADVTHYVKEGTALDKEALKRGTSVYLVDRVIPMLPHKLSNGICSLNAGVDRLALSCIMKIDARGNVLDHQICESVINVNQRMSYTSVKKILADKDTEEIKKYETLVPMFQLMEELSAILRNKRYERGAIDFDFPEAKILLDESGKPIDIKPYERNVATKIIEDFMLLANETIAETYFWQEVPFVYRVHENPDEEKMLRFSTFINNFGYALRPHNGQIYPKDLQKLMQKLEGTESEALISRLLLRSMKQARYSTNSSGHFGLAANYYCHFTSPIRRYPDLQIHRIIKEQLHGALSEQRISHYHTILDEVCLHSSQTERRAEDAEREVEKLKKVEYIQQYLFQPFDAVISGVTAHGLYVELANTVEGLIPISRIGNDYYIFDESSYSIIGENTGRQYCLGDKVKVRPISTNRELRTIEFEFYLTKEEFQKEWMEDEIEEWIEEYKKHGKKKKR